MTLQRSKTLHPQMDCHPSQSLISADLPFDFSTYHMHIVISCTPISVMTILGALMMINRIFLQRWRRWTLIYMNHSHQSLHQQIRIASSTFFLPCVLPCVRISTFRHFLHRLPRRPFEIWPHFPTST